MPKRPQQEANLTGYRGMDSAASKYKTIAASNPYIDYPRGMEERESLEHSYASSDFDSSEPYYHVDRMHTRAERDSFDHSYHEDSSLCDSGIYLSPEYHLALKSQLRSAKATSRTSKSSGSHSHFSGSPINRNNGQAWKYSPHKKVNSAASIGSPLLQSPRSNDQKLRFAQDYPVEVLARSDNQTKITQPPMKKLFGEYGILGRDINDDHIIGSEHRQPEAMTWGKKLKKYAEEMGKEFSAAFSPHEISKRIGGVSAPSAPRVTLACYMQAIIYMQLELLLSTETNRFLMNQFQYNNVSIMSVKKISDAWTVKGRPQVIGFQYDVGTQRELILANIESLQFFGLSAENRATKLDSVLAGWRNLAKDLAPRTFCQPDSAVKRHLWDAERVLALIGASDESMQKFDELQECVQMELRRHESS